MLATGYGLAWSWFADRLGQGVGHWVDARRAAGWEVMHGPPQRGGWPFSLRLTLPDVLIGIGPHGWRSDGVRLRLVGWRLDQLRAEPVGAQQLILDAASVPVQAEGLVATLPLGATGVAGLPQDGVLRASTLRLFLPSGPAEILGLQVEFTATSAASSGASPSAAATPGTPLVSLRASIAALSVPPRLGSRQGPSGPDSASSQVNALHGLALDVRLTGPWPGTFGPVAHRARRWRDGGGAVEIRAAEVAWGVTHASGSARLSLDPALQPVGSGVLRVINAAAGLDVAASAGLLARRDALAARLLLLVLEKASPEGGPRRLDLPMTLSNGVLAMGPLGGVVRVPPLVWPGSPASLPPIAR